MKPRPLSPDEARRTLLNRIGPKVDQVRQRAVQLGLRPYRVSLCWESYTGEERGEGYARELRRIEILPTPKVVSLDAVAMQQYSAGILPLGSIRLEKVSTTFTQDQLTGRKFSNVEKEDDVPPNVAFFYELQEDGRGDSPAERMKFRLASVPWRRPGRIEWNILLERVSEDRSRSGRSALAFPDR